MLTSGKSWTVAGYMQNEIAFFNNVSNLFWDQWKLEKNKKKIIHHDKDNTTIGKRKDNEDDLEKINRFFSNQIRSWW